MRFVGDAGDAHPRGLSAHPAPVPLPRLVRQGRDRRRGLHAAAAEKAGLAAAFRRARAEGNAAAARSADDPDAVAARHGGDGNSRRNSARRVAICRAWNGWSPSMPDNFFAPDPRAAAGGASADRRRCAECGRGQAPALQRAARPARPIIAGAQEKIVSYLSIKEVRKLLYRLGPARVQGSRLPEMGGRSEGVERHPVAHAAGTRRCLAAAEISAHRPRT